MSEILYEWSFEDKKNRGTLWYIIALSAVIGFSIWGFLTKQYGMSFIILLIAGLFYFVENNSEDTVKVKINDLGINIAGAFYDFKSIENYGIVYKGDSPILLRLNLNKKGIRYIDVKINSKLIHEIKSVLSDYLEETAKVELTVSEKFIKLLKL